MTRPVFGLAVLLLLALAARADDQLRSVQTELKSQGFYYGEITGETSSDTTAALRRYQIRNGLEVTGTLNQETLSALGIGAAPTRVSPATPRPVAPAPPKPPAATPPSEPLKRADQDFLRREEAQRPATAFPPVPPSAIEPDASVVSPPAPLTPPSADLPVLFADTPYATAPYPVQESTLRRAQTVLAQRGFYRAPIDGAPGPATEEALLAFQHNSRLPLTGRLDLETLGALRLLPGRSAAPLRGIVREPERTHRIYRGVIVR